MSWLDNLTTERVTPAIRRHSDSSRVRSTLTYAMDDTAQSLHNGYTWEYAHHTKLEVGTTWYANQAQLAGRRELAERAILETVFEPYTSRRMRLLHAILDSDVEEATRLLGLIDKEIGL